MVEIDIILITNPDVLHAKSFIIILEKYIVIRDMTTTMETHA